MFEVVQTDPPRLNRMFVVPPQYGSPISRLMMSELFSGSVEYVPYNGLELATLLGLIQNEIVAEVVLFATGGSTLMEALEPLKLAAPPVLPLADRALEMVPLYALAVESLADNVMQLPKW